MQEIEGIVEKVLTRILTPQEIVRLKEYARDEYYNLYIRAKDEIEKTIVRAREAYDLSVDALSKSKSALSIAKDASSIANSAKEVATNANNLARGAYRIANQAVSKANEAISKSRLAVEQANQSISKAKEALGIANDAKAVADSAWNKVQEAISIAQTAYDNAVSALEKIKREITPKIKSLSGMLDNAIDNLKMAGSDIRSILDNAKKKIETISGEISSINRDIMRHVDNLKKLVGELGKWVGSARVDYTKLDGRSEYKKYNTGSGVIGDISRIGWDIGQFAYNIAHLISKGCWGIDLGPLGRYEICIPYPRMDRVLWSFKWLYTLATTHIPALIKDTRSGTDIMQRMISEVQAIVSDLTKILARSTAIFSVVTNAIVDIMNVIMSLFLNFFGTYRRATYITYPEFVIPSVAPSIKPSALGHGVVRPIGPPSLRAGKVMLARLYFDDKRGVLTKLQKGKKIVTIKGARATPL